MELTCPVCGSEEVYRGQARRKAFAFWYFGMMPAFAFSVFPALWPITLLWWFFPILFPLFENWQCRNCGARLRNSG